MLYRLVLFIVLGIFVARAFWQFVDGIMRGVRGAPRRRSPVPSQGVHMVRDPVCGTFVLPDRALMIGDGRQRVFFCSEACRDTYRAASRGEDPEGRARTA